MVSKKGTAIKKWAPIYIMAAPGLLYLLINNYIPMLGLVTAFKKIDFRVGIFQSPWVGLDNFTYLFKTKDAFIITRNTIAYNVAFLIINTCKQPLSAASRAAFPGQSRPY